MNNAITNIKNHAEWRIRMNVPGFIKVLPEEQELMKKGPIYFSGLDKNFRPVVVINTQKVYELNVSKSFLFKIQKLSKEAVERLTVYVADNILKRYCHEGKVENWIIIADFKNASIRSLLGNFKQIGYILEQNFRTRLFRLYMVNTPFMISILMFFVRTLDKNIQMKIRNTKASAHPDWWIHIDKDQIEQKYCGSMNDKVFEKMEDLGI